MLYVHVACKLMPWNLELYCIVQNSGGVKLWRINHLRALANLQYHKHLMYSYFEESEIWLGKILTNDTCFAKFTSRILRYIWYYKVLVKLFL